MLYMKVNNGTRPVDNTNKTGTGIKWQWNCASIFVIHLLVILCFSANKSIVTTLTYLLVFEYFPSDPYEKDYETRLVLQSECKEGCDADADCGCNLRSGKFKCACRRGYFGTGEKKVSGSSCQREFVFIILRFFSKTSSAFQILNSFKFFIIFSGIGLTRNALFVV